MYCDFPLLGRCCFCMPLRRGVLTFGYLNIIFSAFMVGVYSSYSHRNRKNTNDAYLVYHGAVTTVPSELCITMYCLDIVFNVVLLYGAHTKKLAFVKIFYYYTLGTIMATTVLQIMVLTTMENIFKEMSIIAFLMAGMMMQLYLLILVRSFLKKLEVSGPHSFDNQLNQIVSGERKVESNGVYDNSTVVPI